LKNLGLFSTCSRERSLIQRLVQLLKKNDMIFGISHSGNTEEVVSAVSLAREYGAFAMGMTNFSPSPLTEAARTTLITGVPEKKQKTLTFVALFQSVGATLLNPMLQNRSIQLN
jgi:DNA-binding MurR/RpiR family transcriptional regulator